jgi:[ribosomal protein S5]-alanine N-acetyltransferase
VEAHDASVEHDDAGMIEIGMGVEPAYRGRGFAKEQLHGMWGWVVDQPGVVTLRYTVDARNVVSQAIIRTIGFTLVGQQVDEEDGPEDIFEMDAPEYRRRFSHPR